jgi:hypothetical protein
MKRDFPFTVKLFLRAILIVLVGALSAPAFSQSAQVVPTAPADELHQLWTRVVDPILRQTVQGGQQSETIGTTMMVPLQAAFRLRDAQWQRTFTEHFSRLVDNASLLPDEDLGRLQYLYLASQFLLLAQASGQQEIIPLGLPELLFSQIHNVWLVKPAWQFAGGGPAFPGGVRERTLWKLKTRRVGKSYFREINDVDFYVFVIAADLKAYGGTAAQKQAWNPMLDDVLAIAHRVFVQEVVPQPGGGWILQPGVWTDHPEYQYAGNKEITPGMKPVPVRGIAPDSSHAHRFPLWLTSLMRAYPPNSEENRFYEGLRSGFEKQVFNSVLVKPSKDFPCYRMNNFMDGSNGVYRWNYPGMGQGSGFGPYGNSYALLVGWWAFVDTDRMRAVYRELAATFPWPKECVEIYLGPTVPNGHPASAYDPGSSSMRLWHLSVWLDSQL